MPHIDGNEVRCTSALWAGLSSVRLIRLICFALLFASFGAGCAMKIVPPAQPRDPATVYLVDSGRTSSLVIPNQAGVLTRYAYGDWDWYALRKTAHWRAIPALLWPTRGALGRMELAAEEMARLTESSEHVYRFEVERADANALTRRLDEEFQREINTLVHTPSVGLDFVHHGYWYWSFHNSNHATTGWLHDLGVKTCGYPAWSAWRVRPPRS